MFVIVGLIILTAAAIVGTVGVLSNAGPTHAMNDTFSVVGYHVTGSTGTLFLFGIVVGAAALLGLSVMLAGARRTAGKAHNAKRKVARMQQEAAFANREHDTRLQHQQRADDLGAESAESPENSMIATLRAKLR